MEVATQVYRDVSRSSFVDELIMDHLEYVRHILGKLLARLPMGVDSENLESAGVLGLIEAARQYDPARGVAFKTYSYPRIRGAILDELRRNCPLSQQMLQQITRVRSACETLDPPLTPEIIAEATGLSPQEVESCLEAIRLTRPESWNEVSCTVHSRWGNSDSSRPDSEIEQRESKTVLADCIEKLPDRERLVLTLYYKEDLRLKEIGAVLKLSESRVSRILARAEFRLKEFVRARYR